MKLSKLIISDLKIGRVTNSSVTFFNDKATVETIIIPFSSKGYGDKVDGYISIDRKETKKLIRELENQLKIRTGKNHIMWCKRRGDFE